MSSPLLSSTNDEETNSNANTTNNELLVAARNSLATLDVQRKALESEAEVITMELTSPPSDGVPPMGLDTPLVDKDGYPRNDIDVYRARHLRHRLSEIRTDHTKLMSQLNNGLQQLSLLQNSNKQQEEKEEQEARRKPKPKPKMDPTTGKWVVSNWDGTVAGIPNGNQRSFDNLENSNTPDATSTTTTITNQMTNTTITSNHDGDKNEKEEEEIPFAKVDAVAMASPAFKAGLREGDLIVKFGSVNTNNNRDLRAIMELVPMAASNNQGITIAIRRLKKDTETETDTTNDNNHYDPHCLRQTLTLHPKPWAGRGLLGCHIVKYPIS